MSSQPRASRGGRRGGGGGRRMARTLGLRLALRPRRLHPRPPPPAFATRPCARGVGAPPSGVCGLGRLRTRRLRTRPVGRGGERAGADEWACVRTGGASRAPVGRECRARDGLIFGWRGGGRRPLCMEICREIAWRSAAGGWGRPARAACTDRMHRCMRAMEERMYNGRCRRASAAPARGERTTGPPGGMHCVEHVRVACTVSSTSGGSAIRCGATRAEACGQGGVCWTQRPSHRAATSTTLSPPLGGVGDCACVCATARHCVRVRERVRARHGRSGHVLVHGRVCDSRALAAAAAPSSRVT